MKKMRITAAVTLLILMTANVMTACNSQQESKPSENASSESTISENTASESNTSESMPAESSGDTEAPSETTSDIDYEVYDGEMIPIEYDMDILYSFFDDENFSEGQINSHIDTIVIKDDRFAKLNKVIGDRDKELQERHRDSHTMKTVCRSDSTVFSFIEDADEEELVTQYFNYDPKTAEEIKIEDILKCDIKDLETEVLRIANNTDEVTPDELADFDDAELDFLITHRGLVVALPTPILDFDPEDPYNFISKTDVELLYKDHKDMLNGIYWDEITDNYFIPFTSVDKRVNNQPVDITLEDDDLTINVKADNEVEAEGDEIWFASEGSKVFTKLIITVNGKSQSINAPQRFMWIEDVYIGKDNGNQFLYIVTSRGGDSYLSIFRLEGEELTATAQMETTICMDYVFRPNYASTDSFLFFFPSDFYDLKTVCAIDENGIPVPKEEAYYSARVTCNCNFVRNLIGEDDYTQTPGHIVKDGKATSETKPIGNYLVAYRTDKKTYVDFIDQEGDILRLTYEKTPEGILLEGIPKGTMMD